jgi:hypothetical protein
MSSDSGIYLHRFTNGWKVTSGEYVENVYEGKEAMKEYFRGAPRFGREEQAILYAWKLYRRLLKEGYSVEDGISII